MLRPWASRSPAVGSTRSLTSNHFCWNPTRNRPLTSFVASPRWSVRTRHSGHVLVIVAPGQGAQTPGFLIPWLEDPVFRSRFEWLSAVAGIDLVHFGTAGVAEAARKSAVSGKGGTVVVRPGGRR